MGRFADPGKAGMKAAKGAAGQGAGLAAELRKTAAQAQAAKARREAARRRRQERKLEQDAQQLADAIIAGLPRKMKEAAAAGQDGVTVFPHLYETDRVSWAAWRLIGRYAESEGLKTWSYKEEPFGSDPMFDRTVWMLGLSWAEPTHRR